MQASKTKIDKHSYDYIEKKIVGKGSYGVVWLCQRFGQLPPNAFNNFFYEKKFDSPYCAIKYYFQKFEENEGVNFSTLRQINLMLTSNHPNIAGAYQAYFHRERLKLVMDFYIDLVDIVHEEQIIKQEYNRRLICYQITRGLAYLHENYIMHRDLKPTNIFVSSEGVIKIGDFGMSKEFGTPNRKFTPYVCTKEYRAPQLYLQTNYYTQKADIWSLGCIFYYIYKGETLFMPDSNSSMAMMIKIFSITGTPNEDNWIGYKKLPKIYLFQPYPKKSLEKQKGLSKDISSLIESCLQLDPKKRPTAKDLVNHEFFAEFNQQFGQAALQVNHIYDKKIKQLLNDKEKDKDN